MDDHTHTSSPCVCGVRVSALWVCPARGGRGLSQGTDGGGWAGGRQGIEAASTARTLPILWPRLGENKQNPDAGFFFFTGTNTALVFWKEKLHPQHNAGGKWNAASCWVVVQVLDSSQLQTCCHYLDIFWSWLHDYYLVL